MLFRYFKVPIVDGIPILNFDFVEHIAGEGNTERYVKLRPGFELHKTWQEISEEDWQDLGFQTHVELPPIKPETADLLGQFMVQQILENAETKQKLDTIGRGLVQLILKGV